MRFLREFWLKVGDFWEKVRDVWGNFESRRFLSQFWGKELISVGEGNGNPLQYSCLENPMDRGAWWATVHRVSKSQTWLSNYTLLISETKKDTYDRILRGRMEISGQREIFEGILRERGRFWGNSLRKKGISEGILKKRRWVWGLLKGGWEGSEWMWVRGILLEGECERILRKWDWQGILRER